MREIKIFSLFSGIGGSSQGYKQAGCTVLGAIEFLDYQANNYRLNFPGTAVYEQDIRTLDVGKVMESLNIRPGELDILDGSPPCSSFSSAGKGSKLWGIVKPYGNKKQRTDDLFFQYVRFLQEMQPRIFIAENVAGLARGPNRGMLMKFTDAFRDAGYKVKAKILNCAYYGVPQARPRLFFIGVRDNIGLLPTHPEPDAKPMISGPALAKVVNTEADLAAVQIKGEMTLARLKGLRRGAAHKERFTLRKSHPGHPIPTLVAAGGQVSSNAAAHWDNRKFTIPELKVICGFPKTWKTTGPFHRIGEGFARAVPPPTMERIARHVISTVLEATNG